MNTNPAPALPETLTDAERADAERAAALAHKIAIQAAFDARDNTQGFARMSSGNPDAACKRHAAAAAAFEVACEHANKTYRETIAAIAATPSR